MLNWGTGSTRLRAVVDKYRYSGVFADWAADFAIARETPRMAFAPRVFLFSVPSIHDLRSM